MTAERAPQVASATSEPTVPTVAYNISRADASSVAIAVTYVLWVLILFEPDWFLSQTIGGTFFRIPTLLAPILGIMVLAWFDKRSVYWPLILFVLLHLAASLLSENQGLSRAGFKFVFYMLLLFAMSATFLNSPARITVVLKLYLLSFIWFGLQGLPDGRVRWHSLLNNEDSYGPLMVMAIAFSYFLSYALRSSRWRMVAQGTCVLGVLGVVVSFARGAALAAAAVLFHVWLRSPWRLATFTRFALGSVVVLFLAGALVPVDRYIEELKSISEGTRAGTGQARWIAWQMGWEVFLQSPLYGVGAGNFGVVASDIIPDDATRAQFPLSRTVYSFALHNAFVQILCEEGLIGIALWLGMIVGFFRRIHRLQTAHATAWWKRRHGDSVDLRLIAHALEGAMVGYLVNSVFYNQLYIHWFWSLITIAYVLVLASSPSGRRRAYARREVRMWDPKVA